MGINLPPLTKGACTQGEREMNASTDSGGLDGGTHAWHHLHTPPVATVLHTALATLHPPLHPLPDPEQRLASCTPVHPRSPHAGHRLHNLPRQSWVRAQPGPTSLPSKDTAHKCWAPQQEKRHLKARPPYLKWGLL